MKYSNESFPISVPTELYSRLTFAKAGGSLCRSPRRMVKVCSAARSQLGKEPTGGQGPPQTLSDALWLVPDTLIQRHFINFM